MNTPLAILHLNSFTDPGYSTKQVNEAKVTSKHCIGLFRMKIGVCLRFFGDRDVRQIRTHTYQEYIADLTKRRPSLAASTKNTLMAAFRNVMKIARDEGVVEVVPQTPRVKSKDNPRPFFRFHPLGGKRG